jgi:hypothetical protein
MARDVIPESSLTPPRSSTTLAPTTTTPVVRRRSECSLCSFAARWPNCPGPLWNGVVEELMTHAEILAGIERLRPWFHCIDLGNRIHTKTTRIAVEPIEHPQGTWQTIRLGVMQVTMPAIQGARGAHG